MLAGADPFSLQIHLMANKRQLKVARDALAQGNFEYASSLCQTVLETDQKDYHALVFLGLAELKQDHLAESQSAYESAIQVNPDLSLAYQGLQKLFEQIGDVAGQLRMLSRLEAMHFAAYTYHHIVQILKKYGTACRNNCSLPRSSAKSKGSAIFFRNTSPNPRYIKQSKPTIFRLK